ncbi:MAG TPA: hypothetical protein VIY48_19980 [Candidatus Paceibacterota bacterium]
MSAEVKSVSEVVKSTVQDIKDTAAKVAENLKKRNDEVKQAFSMVDAFGDELGKSTMELRALLGGATNNPPSDLSAEPVIEKKKKDGWLG